MKTIKIGSHAGVHDAPPQPVILNIPLFSSLLDSYTVMKSTLVLRLYFCG